MRAQILPGLFQSQFGKAIRKVEIEIPRLIEGTVLKQNGELWMSGGGGLFPEMIR